MLKPKKRRHNHTSEAVLLDEIELLLAEKRTYFSTLANWHCHCNSTFNGCDFYFSDPRLPRYA
jgi:hypothetical protein